MNWNCCVGFDRWLRVSLAESCSSKLPTLQLTILCPTTMKEARSWTSQIARLESFAPKTHRTSQTSIDLESFGCRSAILGRILFLLTCAIAGLCYAAFYISQKPIVDHFLQVDGAIRGQLHVEDACVLETDCEVIQPFYRDDAWKQLCELNVH